MGAAFLMRPGGVQFAHRVQGHRAGHFPAGRHGKLLLGERHIAAKHRQGSHLFGAIFQGRRAVNGNDARQVHVGLRPRPAGEEILGLLEGDQSGRQGAAVDLGPAARRPALRPPAAGHRETRPAQRNQRSAPPTRNRVGSADRPAGRPAPTARNAPRPHRCWAVGRISTRRLPRERCHGRFPHLPAVETRSAFRQSTGGLSPEAVVGGRGGGQRRPGRGGPVAKGSPAIAAATGSIKSIPGRPPGNIRKNLAHRSSVTKAVNC